MSKPLQYILEGLLFLVIVIAGVWIATNIPGCNKPETTFIQRDTTLNKKIDSLMLQVQDLKEQKNANRSEIDQNSKKLIDNHNVHKQISKDIINNPISDTRIDSLKAYARSKYNMLR